MSGSDWDPPSAGEGTQAWQWSLSLSKAVLWEMDSGLGPKDDFSFLRRERVGPIVKGRGLFLWASFPLTLHYVLRHPSRQRTSAGG